MKASPYRTLPIYRRTDLQVSEQYIRGQHLFIVGDPLNFQHHTLNEQEYSLLQMLDGGHSAEDIKLQFNRQFAPCRIEYHEIEHYLGLFHQQGLVESIGYNVGKSLAARAAKKRHQKQFGQLKNILAIRLRGINPERLLAWLTPRTAWFFSTWMVAVQIGLMLAALLLVGVNWESFQARLPHFQEFFSPRNWLAIGLVVLSTKILHELGHGIVYTKYGGKCHELGVMILLFMPTLYVNTSGAWRIRSKWQRAAIAAAGMYVELSLAALATWVWWTTQPGVIQYTALNVMVTCSVSSLIFNGNPLMKYDGYFILCDLLELPNLQQRAAQLVRETATRVLFDVESPSREPLVGRIRLWMQTYCVAAYAYRLMLSVTIGFLLVDYSQGTGLEVVAKLMAVASLAAVVIAPLKGLYSALKQPGVRSQMSTIRTRSWMAVVAVTGIIFCCVPFPSSVVCPCTIEPLDVRSVYVEQDGVVEQVLVEPGQWVEEGQVIMVLRDLELEMKIEALRGQVGTLQAERDLLVGREKQNADDRRTLSTLETELKSLVHLLDERLRQKSSLTIRAPRAGHVIPGWTSQRVTPGTSAQLASASTLCKPGEHRYYHRGDRLCSVGDWTAWEAKLSLEASQIQFVRDGQLVKLLAVGDSRAIQGGRVVRLTQEGIESVAATLTVPYGGEVESLPNRPEEENVRTVEPRFAAIVVFEEGSVAGRTACLGWRGTASIAVTPKTLLARTFTGVVRLFRFG